MWPSSLLPLFSLLVIVCNESEAASFPACVEKVSRIWVELEAPVTGWYCKRSTRNGLSFERRYERDSYFVLNLNSAGVPSSLTVNGRRHKARLSYNMDGIRVACPDETATCSCKSLTLSGLPDYNGEYRLQNHLELYPDQDIVTPSIISVQNKSAANESDSFSLPDGNVAAESTLVSGGDVCENQGQDDNSFPDTIDDLLIAGGVKPSDEHCKKAKEYVFRHRTNIWWLRNSNYNPTDILNPSSQKSSQLMLDNPAEIDYNVSEEDSLFSGNDITFLKQSLRMQSLEPLRSHKQKRWAIAKTVDRFKLDNTKMYPTTNTESILLKIRDAWEPASKSNKYFGGEAYNDPSVYSAKNTEIDEAKLTEFPNFGNQNDGSPSNALHFEENNAHAQEDGELYRWFKDVNVSLHDDDNYEPPQPNIDCRFYFQLLTEKRLQKDEALEAWILARGNRILAMSDSITLCPDSASGDWWWVSNDTAQPHEPPTEAVGPTGPPQENHHEATGDPGTSFPHTSQQHPKSLMRSDSKELPFPSLRNLNVEQPVSEKHYSEEPPSLERYHNLLPLIKWSRNAGSVKLMKNERRPHNARNTPYGYQFNPELRGPTETPPLDEEVNELHLLVDQEESDYYNEDVEETEAKSNEKLTRQNVQVTCFADNDALRDHNV